jgi:hypothetical protein
MAPSIFVVGLFGRAQNYDIDRLQIMSKVEVKRSLLKFCHATLAQWDSKGMQYIVNASTLSIVLGKGALGEAREA